MKLVPSFAFALLLVLCEPVASRTKDPCNCSDCDQTSCESAPACKWGGCDQTGTNYPTCFGGDCTQDNAKYPDCFGGECSQKNSKSPKCLGGDCNQDGSSDAKCLGGECSQRNVKGSASCSEKCDQTGAENPSCVDSEECVRLSVQESRYLRETNHGHGDARRENEEKSEVVRPMPDCKRQCKCILEGGGCFSSSREQEELFLLAMELDVGGTTQ
eukprot:scaffold3999_cov138-Skeletonema_dohrnii-CCMP3373.AAC.25